MFISCIFSTRSYISVFLAESLEHWALGEIQAQNNSEKSQFDFFFYIFQNRNFKF